MTSLHARFQTADRAPTPDLWPEVERRLERYEAPAGRVVVRSGLLGAPGRLVLIVVVLLVLVATAIVVLSSLPPPPPLPNVNRLLFVSRLDTTDDGRLSVLDPATGTPHVLYEGPVQSLFASPNGQYVVFEDLAEHEMVIAPTDGTAPVHLPPAYLGREWEQIWAPDSHAIAWDTSDSGQLVVQSVAGTRQVIPLPPIGQRGMHAAVYQVRWSPDSRHVALHSYEHDVSRRFLIVDTVTETVVEVGNLLRVESPPVWSPDGSQLAAVVFYHESPTLVIVERTTGEFSVVADHFEGGLLAWSADSAAILYLPWSPFNSEIRRLSIAGGSVTRVTEAPKSPLWETSPDGTALAGFELPDPAIDTWNLVVWELDGATRRVALDVEPSGPTEWPKWSPDGQWIAFHRRSPDGDPGLLSTPTQIWVVRRDGTNEHMLTEVWDYDLVSADW